MDTIIVVSNIPIKGSIAYFGINCTTNLFHGLGCRAVNEWVDAPTFLAAAKPAPAITNTKKASKLSKKNGQESTSKVAMWLGFGAAAKKKVEEQVAVNDAYFQTVRRKDTKTL